MNIKNQLINYANEFPDQEICALVYLDNVGNHGFIKTENKHSNKKNYFTISAKEYKKAYELGKVVAVFHSHVNDNSEFSPLDYQQASGHNIGFWMFDIKTQSFKELNTSNYKYLTYLNRHFDEGSQDCFSLVREFYAKELNIKIPNYFSDRRKAFLVVQQQVLAGNTFFDLAAESGFIQVPSNELKNFDILFFKFDNRLHMAIYLEPGCLLHQLRNKNSCIERMSDEYIENLIGAFRYG